MPPGCQRMQDAFCSRLQPLVCAADAPAGLGATCDPPLPPSARVCPSDLCNRQPSPPPADASTQAVAPARTSAAPGFVDQGPAAGSEACSSSVHAAAPAAVAATTAAASVAACLAHPGLASCVVGLFAQPAAAGPSLLQHPAACLLLLPVLQVDEEMRVAAAAACKPGPWRFAVLAAALAVSSQHHAGTWAARAGSHWHQHRRRRPPATALRWAGQAQLMARSFRSLRVDAVTARLCWARSGRAVAHQADAASLLYARRLAARRRRSRPPSLKPERGGAGCRRGSAG